PGARVMGEVTTRHTFDGGSNGRQPDDGPSLGPSRSSPFSSWATEVLMNRQMSGGLS
ncbi:hypothetical protein HAX54_048141, partial [Datura stramonium]|nr:hypothetical protein [Datura stramonium]